MSFFKDLFNKKSIPKPIQQEKKEFRKYKIYLRDNVVMQIEGETDLMEKIHYADWNQDTYMITSDGKPLYVFQLSHLICIEAL